MKRLLRRIMHPYRTWVEETMLCRECHGVGYVYPSTRIACQACRGKGRVPIPDPALARVTDEQAIPDEERSE